MEKDQKQEENTRLIREAVELADQNVYTGKGGPFGAIITRNGEIIAAAANCVIADNDPTAHAEIVAIREACKKTENYFLEDCEIFCSCEPCPMCLGAIYWAHIKTVYYCADRDDAARAGFDDSLIYSELLLDVGKRKLPVIRISPEIGNIPFKKWIQFTEKKPY